MDLEGMPPPLTPSPQFYRIDTALTPPAVDVDSWTLTISGMVSAPITYTYADLMAMPQVSKYVTLACISNEVGGDLVGNALWQGVPLTALLKAAGVSPAADQIMGMSVDGFTAGFPTALAFDGREPLLALGMNGEPLPVDHGFPARLVVPGLYGYVSATKWISEIRLTTFADEEGFWVRRGWISDGRIAMASRIDVPAVGAKLNAGPMTIAGRAWHQTVPIGRVELSIDNGPWKPAVLADSMGLDCWRLWSYSWDAPAGEHRIEVRMTDADGAVQSAQITAPGPGPSSGYDRITVTIR